MQHTPHVPLKTAGFAHPVRAVEALGIEPGMLVADLGSGSGHYALAIAQKLQGSGRVYAIDVQRDLLRRIHNEAHKRKLENVSIIWADLEHSGATKIADGHLDLVVISNLLFQLADKKVVLGEARRILIAGGRLAIIDWKGSFGAMGPIKQHVVSEDQARELARSSGFEPAGAFDAGAHHYGLLFRTVPHA